MFDVITSLFKSDAHQQSGPQEGEYYKRSGSCHQCGHCCTNIYLVHRNEPIQTVAEFEALKVNRPEYRYFTPMTDPPVMDPPAIDRPLITPDSLPEPVAPTTTVEISERRGLRFHCMHLQADKSCGIYEKRPSFCRRYPMEEVLRMGGALAENCGYRFELKRTFSQVLDQTARQA